MRHPWTTAFILSVLVILAVPASAQPAPGKRPVRVPLATPEQQAPLEAGIDRYGSDYRSVELAEPKPELCRDECGRDERCKAYTYVKPGVQGDAPVCWLKDAVPEPSPNEDCVSGVKKKRERKGR